MGTHLIPREIDGDARILLIFTPKGFIGTLIGIGVGTIFYTLAVNMGATIVGWVLLGICALIGFIIGQVKLPESNAFTILKKVGGDYVRDVIVKYVAFKKKRKIYVYEQSNYNEKNSTINNAQSSEYKPQSNVQAEYVPIDIDRL